MDESLLIEDRELVGVVDGARTDEGQDEGRLAGHTETGEDDHPALVGNDSSVDEDPVRSIEADVDSKLRFEQGEREIQVGPRGGGRAVQQKVIGALRSSEDLNRYVRG
jgi:hypothetical protein